MRENRMKRSSNGTDAVSSTELAHFKRLLELWMADPKCKADFADHPEAFLDIHGLRLDIALAVQELEYLCRRKPGRKPGLYVSALQERIDGIHAYYERETGCEHMTNDRFRKWYLRQTAGYRFQSLIARTKAGLFYMPMVFELSTGCSVGCDFCCLDAEPLKRLFRYTEENRILWRDVLQISQQEIGEIVRMGVCYFATEPLDNPDYEKFLGDFHEQFGRYPQTTTAILNRDADRTRRLLRLLGREELSLAAVRGSIVSRKQLREIHAAFSPEELADVELLTNNPESINAYSRSGRSIGLSEGETLSEKDFCAEVSSICVCGFVVSMAKKTVMLAAPHVPDEVHPKGMKVFGTERFDDAGGYRRALHRLIERFMPEQMPEDALMYRDCAMKWEHNGFRLKVSGNHVSRTISLSDGEYRCFEQMMDGRSTLQQAVSMEKMTGYERQRFTKKMKVLYDGGCLDIADV